MVDYVKITNWLYFGNNHNCGNKEFRNQFDRTLHIWRNDYPDQKCSEDLVYVKDLQIDYEDACSLSVDMLHTIFGFYKTFEKDFPDFRNNLSDSGKLYVHCAAGQTRSSTIALFIQSIADMRHPASLLNHYYWRGYEQREFILNISETPLMDIICYYENEYIPSIIGKKGSRFNF